ncbi:mannose-1-phosphate guanylyltransferase [Prevotella intermedia]|uniref:Mannose-1-phosphate guanylyltransferase n=1 Tax=Prevotella intermedia TaxID=28131 RepID=A0A0S3UJN6_PREIN|nr:sugar phosphate nucleotidyltransferase [Prevotella intermedia]AWX07231.1 mannose-1-phosphate guanylyltransferase [Prevotella intermedia]BAU17732.1 mannose-1-phosphate guanylyltransferase [Prevotella intermedia]
MEITDNNSYCVILAGGKGKRLWPVSREKYPKQFIDFFSEGRTQLQQTFDRFLDIVPKDNIFIVTSQLYYGIVRKQLPEVAENNIISEPTYRNTAPSVAWAARRISKINSHANVIISPSDQSIMKPEIFKNNIQEGLNFIATHNCLLALGVQPTRAETAYGYIQKGSATTMGDIYKVKAFTEKPDAEFAQMFVDSNEWLWNTGMYLGNVKFLKESLQQSLAIAQIDFDATPQEFDTENEEEFAQHLFPAFPNMSIDYGVLEKSPNVHVLKCDFGWVDLGTWRGMYDSKSRGKDDNVVASGEVLFDDSSNNIVRLPNDKFAILNGLDGFIVAEKDNVLLVCKKENSSALIRKYVNEAQLKKGEEFI